MLNNENIIVQTDIFHTDSIAGRNRFRKEELRNYVFYPCN